MSYAEKYDDLYQFFAGYLNQSWKEIYIWENQEPGYQAIVRKYKTENQSQDVEKTVAELKEIIETGNNFDYDQWVEILAYDLGLGLRPNGFNLTHQEWLENVLEILEEPAEKTQKYFIPKRIGE